jgi:small subunit ribosomal protein S16
MALRIRLARGGAKKRPFYKLVVTEKTNPRDGKFLERLGSYNPLLEKGHEERFVANIERIKHWISVGAKISDRVEKLLSEISIVKKPDIKDTPQKSAPKKKAQERLQKTLQKATPAIEQKIQETTAAVVEEKEETVMEQPPSEKTVEESRIATAEEQPKQEASPTEPKMEQIEPTEPKIEATKEILEEEKPLIKETAAEEPSQTKPLKKENIKTEASKTSPQKQVKKVDH